ncbi:PTS sugar transporter subunit IIB [Mycoplasma marinum]|nr:PTS sugar transporter subunit IIB [Mycoplasma marinum]
MKILLACSAGMSTSLLEKSMQDYMDANNIEGTVRAMSSNEAKGVTEEWDIVMLGPQVRYMLAGFKEITEKPVIVIAPQYYALAKGEEVVNIALEELNK